MSENEKALRRELEAMKAAYPGRAPKALVFLDAMVEAHAAALSAARTEALEEAARDIEQSRDTSPRSVDGDSQSGAVLRDYTHRLLTRAAEPIRALITTPAPASIPVERVREVLAQHFVPERVSMVLRDLVVPLDAAQEETPDAFCECGEVLSAHRRGGRRGIDEVDPPYRTLCVGFRAKVTP